MLFRNPLKCHLQHEGVKPVDRGAAWSPSSGWEGRWERRVGRMVAVSQTSSSPLPRAFSTSHSFSPPPQQPRGTPHPRWCWAGVTHRRAKKFSSALRCLLLLVCFGRGSKGLYESSVVEEEHPRDSQTHLRHGSCSCRPAGFFTKVTEP